MSKLKFEKSGFRKFWQGKGFLVALAVCLVAVGGVAYSAFSNSLFSSEYENNTTDITSEIMFNWENSDVEDVNKNKENVPIATSSEKEESEEAPVSETPSSMPTEQEALANNTKQTFAFPAGRNITKEFSMETLLFSKTLQDWRVHNGIDFSSPKGTEVKASANGTVLSVKADPLWGRVIEIDHGSGVIIYYCGVSDEKVKKDQTVDIGDVIAYVDNVPCEAEDGTHIHIRVEKDGKVINPTDVLGKRI